MKNANRMMNDQIKVLLYVWRNGPTAFYDIVEGAGLPTETTTIHGMMKKGELKREECHATRLISLTEKGLNRLERWRDKYALAMILKLMAQRVRDREGNHPQSRPVPDVWGQGRR